jgi:hypothetical protein
MVPLKYLALRLVNITEYCPEGGGGVADTDANSCAPENVAYDVALNCSTLMVLITRKP